MGKFVKPIVLTLIFTITFLTTPYQSDAISQVIFITIKINGNIIAMDSLPYIENDSTLVPVRFISEALDADVEWLGDQRKVLITTENKNIELTIDSTRVLVNGTEYTLPVPARIQNSRTMVPVRFLAEILDFTVDWDSQTYSVLINKDGTAIPASSVFARPYSDQDIIWLSRIIHVEAMNLSMEGKVAVGNVVLNRKNDTDFPNTVYDVIFDSQYTIQFPPAHKSGFRELVPCSEAVIAAKMALEGINNIDQCLFFNNSPFKSKSSDLYKIIEGEYFYY